MTFLMFVGVLLMAVAGGLLARTFALSRLRTTAQLKQIDTYGFKTDVPDAAAAPVSGAPFSALAARVGRATAGTGWRAPLEGRSLRAAGLYSLTAEAFHGYRVMCAIGMPLLLLVMVSAGGVGALQLALVASSAGLCWVAPAMLVRSRARRRMNEIDRSLPELVDVLIATLEAGLGFAGSLQLVADRFAGPLGQELRLTLSEQSMGLSSERALDHLLERCDTPSVRAFVRAVQQGELLGVSIATTMRNLATETRKRRRQNAHAEIQRAPVKLLFPLILLIFPALLIVILYPAAVRLVEQLGG